MVGFPEVPTMLQPFCGTPADSSGTGDRASEFPNTGVDSVITYQKGIPLPYSIPTDGGGVKFTRQEMNRLGYDATVGTFKAQFGWRETFDTAIGGSGHTGYPKGARLVWYRLATQDTNANVPDGTKFPNHVNAYSQTATYSVGDVVSYTQNGTAALYACNTSIQTAESWNATHWTQIVVSDAIEVVSLVDDNREDFRDGGPTGSGTGGNYWEYANRTTPNFFPNYSDLQIADNLLLDRTTSAAFKSDMFTMTTNGWIFLSVSRVLDTSSFTTVGEVLTSYADGVRLELTNAQSANPILSYSYQFGAGNSIVQLIPVSTGDSVVLYLTDSRSDSITVKLYRLGGVG